MNNQDYHLLFLSIINGLTSISDSNFGDIYIKHLNQFDSLLIQKEYSRYLEEAKNKGLPTYYERERFIIKENLWTQEKENKIKETKQFIEGLNDNLSREYRHSKRVLLKREVQDAAQRIDKLLIEKNFYIGSNAEQFASKQSLYLQVKLSLFKDELFKEKLINEDDEEEYERLIKIYNKSLENLTQDTLKRIAISSFFNNVFNICGDNAYFFYGKPIVNLTIFQTDLFLWGRYFKSYLDQYRHDIPPSMSKNPDDMMEFFEIRENTKKSGILEGGDENTVATTVMGSSKEDLKLMGVPEGQVRDIGKDIQKAGGHLSQDALFKIKNG